MDLETALTGLAGGLDTPGEGGKEFQGSRLELPWLVVPFTNM